MSIEKKSNKNWTYIVTFFAALLMNLLSVYGTFEMKLVSDNMGSLFMPATLAGRDWTELIQQVPYYGWAYYIFLTPIFKLTTDPYVIYVSVCAVNLVILSLVSVLAYHVLVKFFQMKKGVMPIMIAVICTTYAIAYSWNFSSEQPNLLIIWIVAYLLLKTQSVSGQKGKFIVYSILTAVVIAYSYNIHTRLIILWIGIAVAAVIYLVLYKKWFLHPIAFALTSAAGFLGARMLKSEAIQYLWQVESISDLHNATTAVGKYVEKFSGSLKTILDIEFSNYYKLNMETFGIMTVCLLTILIFLAGIITMRVKKETVEEEQNALNQKVCMITTVFGATLVGTIAALPLYYASGIAEGYAQGIENRFFSAFTYMRYYYMFFGPLFVAAMAILDKKLIQKDKMKVSHGVILTVTLALYVFCFVLPKLNVYYQNFYYEAFVENDVYRFNLIISTLLVIAALAVWYICIKKQKMVLMVGLLFATTVMYEFDITQSGFGQLLRATGGDATYSVIQTAEEAGADIPQTIYFLGEDIKDIQFMLNWHNIAYTVPDEAVEEAIVITESQSEEGIKELQAQGYQCRQLDSNEYMWIKGEALEKALTPYIDSFISSEKELQDNKITYDRRLVKLGRLLYAQGDTRTVKATINNPVDGTYLVQITADAVRIPSDANSYIEVSVDGGTPVTYGWNVGEAQNVGSAELELKLNQRDTVDITLYLSEGTIVKNLDIQYTCKDMTSTLGAGRESELEHIGSVMENLDLDLPVYVLNKNYQYQGTDTSILKAELNSKDIQVLSNGKQNWSSYNKNGYILLEQDETNELIFDLVNHYDILAKTNQYTLLINRNAENQKAVEEAGIRVLSQKGKVNVDYFRIAADGTLANSVVQYFEEELYAIEMVGKDTAVEGDFVLLNVNNETTISLKSSDAGSLEQTIMMNAEYPTTFDWFYSYTESMGNYEAYISICNYQHQVGDIISFADANRKFYNTGLYPTEAWGTWSCGNTSEFIFEMERVQDMNLKLQMRTILPQKVTIYVNGEVVAEYDVTTEVRSYDIPVSKELIKDGTLILTVEAEQAYNAGEIAGNSDVRNVAVAFIDLEFEEK